MKATFALRSFLLGSALLGTANSVRAASPYTWDGGGMDGNWTTADNWGGNTLAEDASPGFSALRFGGISQLNSNNNFTASSGGFNASGIEFLAGAGSFNLTGNSIDLLGSDGSGILTDFALVSNSSTSTQTIGMPLILRPDFTAGAEFNAASGNIAVSGVISGNLSQLKKTGGGVLTLSGAAANTYTGLTTVSAGTLTLAKNANTVAVAGNLVVQNGAILSTTTAASNQIGNSSSITIEAGGRFSAGIVDTVGAVSATGGTGGSFNVGSSSNLSVSSLTLTGTTGGSSYSLAANSGNSTITIGSGGLTMNGAVYQVGQTSGTRTAKFVLNGNFTSTGSSQLTVGGGTQVGQLDLGTSVRTFDVTGTMGIAPNIIGTGGGINKTGSGTLTLTGTNTYTGNTTVTAGTLAMATNLIAGSPLIRIDNGATMSFGNSNFTLAANQSITGLGATGSFTSTGANAFIGVVTSGGTTISSSGTLTLSRLSVLGAGNQITAGDIQTGGTTNGVTRRGLLIGQSGSGTLTITGGSLTSNGGSVNSDVLGASSDIGDGTLIIDGGSYVNTAGDGALFFGVSASTQTAGTLTLTSGSATIHTLGWNAGSTSGSGIVNLNGGTLTVSAITSASGATRDFNFDGGQFVASGNVTFDNTLTLNVKDGGAKIDTGANGVSVSGNLVNSGTGGLTKTGSGTLTLSGTNTYTGDTTASAGTLYVTGALSQSAVTVEANGTIGRNGATNGGLGNGLTILAGGNLDLTGASLGADSTGILGIGSGTLTLGNLTFQDLIGWEWANAAPGTYELIEGGFTVNFGSTAYLSPATAYDFGNGKKGYFTSGSLNAVIIPEPSATALLGGLGMMLLLRRRR